MNSSKPPPEDRPHQQLWERAKATRQWAEDTIARARNTVARSEAILFEINHTDSKAGELDRKSREKEISEAIEKIRLKVEGAEPQKT